MSGLRLLAGIALVASVWALPSLRAQQPPAAVTGAAPSLTPIQIKNELEKIKKGRTFALGQADGMEDTEGATVLRVENASAFNLVVLLVGPTTLRIELEPDRKQALTIEPGAYEIAVVAVDQDIPPLYGTQRIMRHMRFRHQFVIPASERR